MIKLLLLIMAALSVASAIEGEDHTGMLYKICGDDLSVALQEACTKKSVHYLIKHGIAYNERDHSNHHANHNRRNHDSPDHSQDHSHNHSHDSSHSHAHSKQEKQEVESVMDKCCRKPCSVKDFVAFCGEDRS